MPTSKTTKHIPKTKISEGGVNSKGQQLVTDNKGIPRFIDRKKPRIMGPSGVPISPPQIQDKRK